MATSDSAGSVEHRPDPERLLCPRHHHDCWDQRGPTVYCKSCGHSYRYQDCIDPVALTAAALDTPDDHPGQPGQSSPANPR